MRFDVRREGFKAINFLALLYTLKLLLVDFTSLFNFLSVCNALIIIFLFGLSLRPVLVQKEAFKFYLETKYKTRTITVCYGQTSVKNLCYVRNCY